MWDPSLCITKNDLNPTTVRKVCLVQIGSERHNMFVMLPG